MIDEALIKQTKEIVVAEITPIDDIRSTARYRAAVAGNLVAEFLRVLASSGKDVIGILARWNLASLDEAVAQILACCGSPTWARQMAARRPYSDESAVAIASDEVWRSLETSDWMEAFRSHPRIGESVSSAHENESSAAWAQQEQSKAADAADSIKAAMAEANREYENKFGHIFIVCATGKSAQEMLDIITRRMSNNAETELYEAAEEQRQIIQLRLKKWLQS
jgi:2-oxo-4-hydroxy-4-carboxy-5-ureidoimidazoline decarboxylase